MIFFISLISKNGSIFCLIRNNFYSSLKISSAAINIFFLCFHLSNFTAFRLLPFKQFIFFVVVGLSLIFNLFFFIRNLIISPMPVHLFELKIKFLTFVLLIDNLYIALQMSSA